MEENKMPKVEAEEKVQRALMQALIRIAALEKAILKKKIITDTELAEALGSVISDVAKTAKDELGVQVNFEE